MKSDKATSLNMSYYELALWIDQLKQFTEVCARIRARVKMEKKLQAKRDD